MNRERWEFVKRIYYQALDLGHDEWETFIREACAGDEDARREVESLLDAHHRAGEFIVKPAFEAAAEAIAEKLDKIEPGRMLGHYEILEDLGAGGMGAVYLAQDSRLGRKIAIKVLPDTLATDGASLRRFRREARAASATNHPNILTIHEIGEIDGANYIVTEFVDGETLRRRLKSEWLSIETALDVAIQIASALEAAHEAGVAHRDIKPENIMLRRDGIVKVLDFGIAKLVEAKMIDGGRRQARSAPEAESRYETETGMIIGTAPYMSPEQAKGEKDIDSRTDIFSLGVVLYEMITGKSPFASPTFAETLASILHSDPPPLRAYRAGVPPELEKIVAKAISKRREDRYRAAEEMRGDLTSLKRRLEIDPRLEQPQSSANSATAAETRADPIATKDSVYRPNRRAAKIGAAATMTIAAAAVIAYMIYQLLSHAPPTFRAEAKRLTSSGKIVRAAISPDGNYIAYAEERSGKQSLWFKHVDAAEPKELVPSTDLTYEGLTFSPDDVFVYYVSRRSDKPEGELYRINSTGGTPKMLIERIDTPVTFSPDWNQIAFGRGDSGQGRSNLIVANADGSGEKTLAWRKFADYFCLRGIAWSPDGKMIACSSRYNVEDAALENVVVVQVSDGKETKVPGAGWREIRGLAWPGKGDGLMVVASEKGARRSQIFHLAYPSGEVKKITTDSNNYNGISLSTDSKKLVTTELYNYADIWIAPGGGDFRQAKRITSGEEYYDLSWASDSKILASKIDNDSRNLWLMDADWGNHRQLTFDNYWNFRGRVTRDGRIVYVSNPKGAINLWRMNADGSNKTQLTFGDGEYSPRPAPDGRIFYWSDIFGRRSVWAVSIEGGAPQPFTDRLSWNPAVSPDGKFIACYYGNDENEMQRHIAIIPISGGPPVRVFEAPFSIIQWTRGGEAIYYYDTREGKTGIWAQPIDGSKPKRLTYPDEEEILSFDWSPDGRRIAVLRGKEQSNAILLRD